MKIVNRQTFLALPDGTVFAKYEPCCFEDLLIKHESTETDFFYSSIVDAIDCGGSEQFAELLEQAENDGISLKMDFDSISRDGCFDENQLFAVYEKQDIEQLIAKLEKSLAAVPAYMESITLHGRKIIAAEVCPICHLELRVDDIHAH